MFGPNVNQARASLREERRFWSWSDDDYRIREVSGFRCSPDEDSYWWVPELGYTLTVGRHLFSTRQDAARAAFTKITNEIARLQELQANIDA